MVVFTERTWFQFQELFLYKISGVFFLMKTLYMTKTIYVLFLEKENTLYLLLKYFEYHRHFIH